MDIFLRSFPVFFLAILLVLLPVVGTAADAGLFPLSPGNSWTYRDMQGNLESLVITQVLEEKNIPLIEATYNGIRPFYYILTTQGIFRLQPAMGNDPGDHRGDLTLLLRWPLDPGQTWQSPWSDPPLSFTVLDRGQIKVAAGNFRDGIKIGYRPVSSPIYQGYIWFKPGVGILAHQESAYRSELISYSQTDLLAPAALDVTGDKLAVKFKSPTLTSDAEPAGPWMRLKNLLLSGPFYLFLFLVFVGFVALVSYMNSRKIEVDFKDDPEIQEGEATLASAMVREGLFEEASQILQRLTAKHPQWPDIAALLGRSYRETGKFEEARLELKRALTLNPGMSKARLELVRTYLKTNEPSRALEEVEMVLAENGGFADAIYLKGEVLVSMGLDEEAIKCFREALEINPSFAEAQRVLEKTLAEEN